MDSYKAEELYEGWGVTTDGWFHMLRFLEVRVQVKSYEGNSYNDNVFILGNYGYEGNWGFNYPTRGIGVGPGCVDNIFGSNCYVEPPPPCSGSWCPF